MSFMAAGCGLSHKDLDTARRVLDTLDLVGSYSMKHHAEAERVLSLGVPLARMIYHGMIARLTSDGRYDLAETAEALEIVAEVSRDDPRATTRDLWIGVDKARTAAQDVPVAA